MRVARVSALVLCMGLGGVIRRFVTCQSQMTRELGRTGLSHQCGFAAGRGGVDTYWRSGHGRMGLAPCAWPWGEA
jgi:hypothetical protein